MVRERWRGRGREGGRGCKREREGTGEGERRGGATDQEARQPDVMESEDHDLLPGRVSIVLACLGQRVVLSQSGDFDLDEAPLAVREGVGVSCFGVEN